MSLFLTERTLFHAEWLRQFSLDASGVPPIADKENRLSISIATRLMTELSSSSTPPPPHTVESNQFGDHVLNFVRKTFSALHHLRAGRFRLEACKRPSHAFSVFPIELFEELAIWRKPVDDDVINVETQLVDDDVSRLTSLRSANNPSELLHASISCKFTLRSDRAQNARTEALNLIRNRKGCLPHIVVVTAEPMPARIASLALGTGDIDCAYHFALPELQEAVEREGAEDAAEMLSILVDGKRLKDIADLPLDLAI